jgi:CheY-like chemotaxis protein
VVRETLALRAHDQRLTNIAVIDALAAGLPAVFADGHQIQQVLLNLVINAEQAMLSAHGRGMLVVRTWHDEPRGTVILEINDDGPGIPDEVQPKIFDPFFTTKEVGKGTGLGLTVAYAIIQEHGGRIRLESPALSGIEGPPGNGASFFIELPINIAKDAAARQRSRQALSRPGSQAQPVAKKTTAASILVVEDEAQLASAVVEALIDAGYAVEHAADGEAALARVRARPHDLVVCDLKMPRLDGKAFFRRLESAAPKLRRRVIFVTGDVAGTDAEQFLQESGCRWLAKPFRLAELVGIVKEVLGGTTSQV